MTTLVEISSSQAQKETTANENFKAVAPAGLFGKKHTTTSGLTFGYYGGVMRVDGVLTTISDGTVSLTNGATNYIEATRAGVVSANTSAFTAGRIPLFTAVTASSAISTLTDYRVWAEPQHVGSVLAKTWPSDADYTLSAAEAAAKYIVVSGGSLTAQRDLEVPLNGDWFVQNDTTGGQAIRVVEAGSPQSAGVVIANGSGAFVYGDGSQIRRASADV